MSRATVQSLTILAAMKSGLVTAHDNYPDLNQKFKADILEADNLLTLAIKGWEEHKDDNSRALVYLQKWSDDLQKNGLSDTVNLTTMIAMSQQACDDLWFKVNSQYKQLLLAPIMDILTKMGAYLQEGVPEKNLIPKFELADLILEKLYKITGFTP